MRSFARYYLHIYIQTILSVCVNRLPGIIQNCIQNSSNIQPGKRGEKCRFKLFKIQCLHQRRCRHCEMYTQSDAQAQAQNESRLRNERVREQWDDDMKSEFYCSNTHLNRTLGISSQFACKTKWNEKREGGRARESGSVAICGSAGRERDSNKPRLMPE